MSNTVRVYHFFTRKVLLFSLLVIWRAFSSISNAASDDQLSKNDIVFVSGFSGMELSVKSVDE